MAKGKLGAVRRRGSCRIQRVLGAVAVTVGMLAAAIPAGADTPTMPGTDRNSDGRDDLAVVRINGDLCGLTWYWGAGTSSESLGHYPCVDPSAYAVYTVPGRYVGGRFKPYEAAAWHSYSPGQYTKSSGSFLWGEPGDDPTVLADYDGDGLVDPAVYREGTPSTWHIRGSRVGTFSVAFGEEYDVPAPGDYDGDRRADAAVARVAPDGTLWFHIGQTTSGPRIVHFGEHTDDIVPGDFDGDDRADITVTRNVGGVITWYVRRSRGGVSTYRFGDTATDLEAPGDYDGDGRTDIAVWRVGSPSRFYVLQSSTGQMVSTAFGEEGDHPTASSNVHSVPDWLDYGAYANAAFARVPG